MAVAFLANNTRQRGGGQAGCCGDEGAHAGGDQGGARGNKAAGRDACFHGALQRGGGRHGGQANARKMAVVGGWALGKEDGGAQRTHTHAREGRERLLI